MELIDPLNFGPQTTDDHYRRLAVSDSQYQSQAGKMMLDFLDRLRRDVVGPRLFVSVVLNELWLQYADGHGHQTLITTTIDHKDYSPLVDGVPLLHYRLAYPRRGVDPHDNLPKVELRTHDVKSACEFVLEAIKMCKGPA